MRCLKGSEIRAQGNALGIRSAPCDRTHTPDPAPPLTHGLLPLTPIVTSPEI
ncbi:hypothetical protein JXA47_15095 [Candidatus Sumerlaeota bacterium]|nr:hypothetical protein [Candidatus Sumerlaeota bacterium]